MKTLIKKILLLFIGGGLAVAGMAQKQLEKPVQMADGMRSNGKIYVVVAVLLTILIGLFIYVIRLDRKITKLEKQL